MNNEKLEKVVEAYEKLVKTLQDQFERLQKENEALKADNDYLRGRVADLQARKGYFEEIGKRPNWPHVIGPFVPGHEPDRFDGIGTLPDDIKIPSLPNDIGKPWSTPWKPWYENDQYRMKINDPDGPYVGPAKVTCSTMCKNTMRCENA